MNGVNGLGGFAQNPQINGVGASSAVGQTAGDSQQAAAAEAQFQQAISNQATRMGTFVMSFIMNDLMDQLMKDPNDPSAA